MFNVWRSSTSYYYKLRKKSQLVLTWTGAVAGEHYTDLITGLPSLYGPKRYLKNILNYLPYSEDVKPVRHNVRFCPALLHFLNPIFINLNRFKNKSACRCIYRCSVPILVSQAVLRHESVRARLPNFVVIISGDFTFANLNLTFCKPANDGVVYVLFFYDTCYLETLWH